MGASHNAYLILAPQVGISLVSWLQLVFSMNRYHGVTRFERIDLWALLLLMHGAFVRWMAALALVASSLPLQVAMALVASAISWAGFVLVFNAGLHLPSRQQWLALAMSVAVTLLWEVHNHLLLEVTLEA